MLSTDLPIEAGASQGWERYAGPIVRFVVIDDRFGALQRPLLLVHCRAHRGGSARAPRLMEILSVAETRVLERTADARGVELSSDDAERRTWRGQIVRQRLEV